MRNVLLSLVVFAVLVSGAVGGTLATWSDSETSLGNVIETGSLDLRVNNADDLPWGTGVPVKVNITCMIPCKVFGPYKVDLWNAGQCENASHAYIHVKNVTCSNVEAKEGSGYLNRTLNPDGLRMPEPELVAQYGGKVDCTTVPGVGRIGENCTLDDYIYMWIMLDNTTTPKIGTTYPNTTCVYQGKMNASVCSEMYLFDLMPCTPRSIYLWFHLPQPSEEDFGLNYIPNPGQTGYDPQEYTKFNDWPSWALMKDKISFDMEFDLWLEDP